MLCKECNKKSVCKHYDYLLKAIELDVNVNKCEHYSTNLSSYSELTEKIVGVNTELERAVIGKGRINMSDIVALGGGEIKPHPDSMIDPTKGDRGLLDGQNMARSIFRKDLKELSNELDPVNIDKPGDFKVTAIPTELAKCDNPACGAETYIEDKDKCSKCGKDVCPVCSIANMDKQMSISESSEDKTLNINTICEDCWKATLEGPKPKKKRGRPRKEAKSVAKPSKTSDNMFDIEI
jgi:hypothetical protein